MKPTRLCTKDKRKVACNHTRILAPGSPNDKDNGKDTITRTTMTKCIRGTFSGLGPESQFSAVKLRTPSAGFPGFGLVCFLGCQKGAKTEPK